ncbi:MAG: DUF4194 domain-containing protein [Thiopseudomonas sp.]|nr:DUF4194 domain-containing protein [Thiopseudomonas sp.]MCK9465419.1 DUF4194 domain-containing protein [Thiopseudomonas sp.]
MTNIFDQITARAPVEQALEDNETQAAEQEVTLDPTRTAQRLREALQALLSDGLLEQAHKPNLYRTAMHELPQLNALLEPLDLQARVDDVRGLVFLRVWRDEQATVEEDWSHPLVRRQRLTLEQSVLLAFLRQLFVRHEQEAGLGDSNAWVAVDELVALMSGVMGDSGSESKEKSRLLTLLNQLKAHGVVTDPDSHGRVQIRPLIAHLANPETLEALLQQLLEHTSDVENREEQA